MATDGSLIGGADSTAMGSRPSFWNFPLIEKYFGWKLFSPTSSPQRPAACSSVCQRGSIA